MRPLVLALSTVLLGACDSVVAPPTASPVDGATPAGSISGPTRPGGSAIPSPSPSPTIDLGTPHPTTAALGDAPFGPTEEAHVVRVVDGDTIVVDRGFGEERVRYIGVDTPETVMPGSPVEWMGPEASAANRLLVDGRDVVLERDISETDRYGRLLRYVWVRDDGRPSGWLFVNLELLALGFAQVVTYPPDVRYVELYLAAQATARDNDMGLWGSSGPTEQPLATPESVTGSGDCHPSYTGACLAIGQGDYDCAGGAGNGPNYVAGPIRVIGFDEFALDGDGDGTACG